MRFILFLLPEYKYLFLLLFFIPFINGMTDEKKIEFGYLIKLSSDLRKKIHENNILELKKLIIQDKTKFYTPYDSIDDPYNSPASSALSEAITTENMEAFVWLFNGLAEDDKLTHFDYDHIKRALESPNLEALHLMRHYNWKDNQIHNGSCVCLAQHRTLDNPTVILEHCNDLEFDEVVLLTYFGADIDDMSSDLINDKPFGNKTLCAASAGSSPLQPEKNREKQFCIVQFLLSQNAKRLGNEHLFAQTKEVKDLLQSKKRPPIPNEARTIMLDLARDQQLPTHYKRKRKLHEQLIDRELGIKKRK